MGVTDTGSGLRVGCDYCDRELTLSDAVVIWRRRERSDLGNGYIQTRGCEDCVEEALKEEFDRRGFSLRLALRLWRGNRIHAREAECHHCGRTIFFLTETKYDTPYTRRAYCSDFCRDASRELVRQQSASRQRLSCEVCGEPFLPTRSDAKTCGNACRQKAYRQRLAQSR